MAAALEPDPDAQPYVEDTLDWADAADAADGDDVWTDHGDGHRVRRWRTLNAPVAEGVS
jgi:peptide/nickel transport system ATP-binding protein